MISKQIFSLNFMFLSSLIEELCIKEENDKTGFNLILEMSVEFTGELQLSILICVNCN